MADLQPELQQQDAVCGQLVFKLVNFGVGPAPFLAVGKAFHPFHQYPPVPAPVEDRHVPPPREVAPEAPQVVMGLFLIGRCGNRDDLAQTRIDTLGQATDCASLAGRIDALEQEQE